MKILLPILLLTSGCASRSLKVKLEAAEARAAVAEQMSKEYAKDRDRFKSGWKRAMKSLRGRIKAGREWREIAEACASRNDEEIDYGNVAEK